MVFVIAKFLFISHLHWMLSLGDQVGIFPLCWCGKTSVAWWVYQMAKKVWEYVDSFRYNTRMWQTDRRTDVHCTTA